MTNIRGQYLSVIRSEVKHAVFTGNYRFGKVCTRWDGIEGHSISPAIALLLQIYSYVYHSFDSSYVLYFVPTHNMHVLLKYSHTTYR